MSLFGTAGIRGDVKNQVTPQLALTIGQIIGSPNAEFVIGRDGRTTGEGLCEAMSAGILSVGGDVIRLGQVPSPTLAFASQDRQGVMITASHNPPADNGIKLFEDGVEYTAQQEQEIANAYQETTTPVEWSAWGSQTEQVVLEEYRSTIVSYALSHGSAPTDLSIAIDCGNGMAGLATPQVLRELGARVTTLNGNIDGHFPARSSKPTPDSLAEFTEFVQQGEFDIGIAHDGDADRIVVLNENGTIVHEDTIVAILARYYTKTSDATDPVVVTTPNASTRIDEQVSASGGRVTRVPLGKLHEGMINIRQQSNDDTEIVFAAEPWKHIHPDLGGWIDGIASAAILAMLVAQHASIMALTEDITQRPYRKESLDCPESLKHPVMNQLEKRLKREFPAAELSTDHGIRLSFSDGSWILVRQSGTEPKLRLYCESDRIDDLFEKAKSIVSDTVADNRK